MGNSKDFVTKYKKFIDKKWIEKISKNRLDLWINNFGENTICAEFLLDALMFYSEQQIIALINEIVNGLQSQLGWKSQIEKNKRCSDNELFLFWESFVKETCLFPASKLETPGSSGHSVVRLWRDNSNFEISSILNIENKIQQGCKNIYFVDDFIGTGTRIEKFLTTEIELNKSISIIDIVNNNRDIKFGVITFVAYKNSLEMLRKNYPQIEFLSSEIIDDKYNLLSDHCLFYANYEEKKKEIIEYLSEKIKESVNWNKYALNLSLAFDYGFPNNALELYWTQDIVGWEYLIKHRRDY